MALLIEKLHPLFVAEISGVDLTRPVEPETIAEIRSSAGAYGRPASDAIPSAIRPV